MAAHWFHKAAEQGEAMAQHSLGTMYAQGIGVAKNDDEAIYWYRKVAEQDLKEAKKIINDFDKNDEISPFIRTFVMVF